MERPPDIPGGDGRPAAADELAPPLLAEIPPAYRRLDAAAALAFRTPLQEHPPAADTKAGAILTALGLMFTILARYGPRLSAMLRGHNLERWPVGILLLAFAGLALAAIVQAFRTISPRFPKAPPSLAFFGDIARLPREEYVRRVEAMTHDDAVEQMINYNHTLATICVIKFAVLRRAVRLFEFAFGCWLVLVIVVNLRVFF